VGHTHRQRSDIISLFICIAALLDSNKEVGLEIKPEKIKSVFTYHHQNAGHRCRGNVFTEPLPSNDRCFSGVRGVKQTAR
jgi:hypothetical protein